MAMVLQGVAQLQSLKCLCLGQCSDAGSGPAHGVMAAMTAQAAYIAFSPQKCHFDGKGLSTRPLSSSPPNPKKPCRDKMLVHSSVANQKLALYSDQLPAKCVGHRKKKILKILNKILEFFPPLDGMASNMRWSHIKRASPMRN